MRRSRFITSAVTAVAIFVVALAGTAGADTFTGTVPSSGTFAFPAGSSSQAVDSVALPELAAFDTDENASADGGATVDRTVATQPGQGRAGGAGKKAKSNPEVQTSFDGINFYQQRLVADGGNQLSVEPPDQGLCVGNGFVVETVNDTIRVFSTTGVPLTAPRSLNQFYGYAHAIDRAQGNRRGPSITDPSCYFDRHSGRFFHLALTLEVNALGLRLGPNHLDLAVSATSDPTGTWTLYKIPAQNDGTDKTPDHHCIRMVGGARVPGPCLADFPHMGVDRDGVYITTNEFNLFATGFIGADIYVLPKAALVGAAPSLPVTLLETRDSPALAGQPGFTLWPAATPGDHSSHDANGTQFFVSSNAVFANNGTSTELIVWALSNTASLATATPDVRLSSTVVTVDAYGVPPKATQRAGDTPVASCLADTTSLAAFGGSSCFQLIGAPRSDTTAAEAKLDAFDSRVTGVSFANGKLWAVLGTAATMAGSTVDGVAWFVLRASHGPRLSASIALQGILAVENANLTYPSIAVTTGGRGVMSFTLVGPNDYPSAAYAGIDAKAGAGAVHVVAAGAGPQDGFTEYAVFAPRARWGDYGAAVTDGRSIWVAAEYIGQACTYEQYLTNTPDSPFGTCGKTRAPLGNWDTRITKLTLERGEDDEDERGQPD